MRTLLCSLALLLATAVPATAASWERVEAPSASGRAYVYRSAAAFGEQEAWAVGYSYGTVGGALVDGPAGFGGALVAVAAAPDGTVWISGEGRNPETGYSIPNVWLRAGAGWQAVPFPPVPGCALSSNGLMARADITDIASRGPRATWATGWCGAPGGGERGFLVRFNGKRRFAELTPDTLLRYGPRGHLTGVSLSPDGEVWVVGWSDDFGISARPVAFRGSHNKVRPAPAPAQGNTTMLYAVATEREGAAVAAGTFTQQGNFVPRPHLMGANGTGLAIEPADPSLVGNLFGIALSPDGTAWAVGVSSWDDRGLILRRTP